MRRKLGSFLVVALLAGVLGSAAPAVAQEPLDSADDLPVLSKETLRGASTNVPVDGPAPAQKIVDGNISDWVGDISHLGGTAAYSGGEVVYQDHLFDAQGPDDGRDARRYAATEAVEGVLPEAYRIDALSQADAPGELGVPTPSDFGLPVNDELSYGDTYGDAVGDQDAADLEEVRLAVQGENLYILARTTTLLPADKPALLLLADRAAGETSYQVPFDSGLSSSKAETALFLSGAGVQTADLATGSVSDLSGASVSINPGGYVNAIEASVPLSSVTSADGGLALGLASGLANDSGLAFKHLTLETADEEPHPNIANVAFRLAEPVRIWFERDQALTLNAGTIDPFFYEVDTGKLASGASEQVVPGHGYHDRIFISELGTGVLREDGENGIFQHYGLFLPESYDGSPTTLQWWLHWRGGSAHSGASVVPKVFTQLGDDSDAIVVAPSGRGSSTWYVGRGHVDFLEVWKDVFETVSVDRDRVYVTGHSMGGWGSYLLTLLYPDRFAAAAPAAGPVTMGAWTGVPYFEGCDDMKYDDYTPCYIEANGSKPRDQHTRKILENALHVPYAILHGTDDELVPYSGIVRQSERLIELGYRHRLYTSPGYEHYSHPIMDQWAEAGRYMHQFTRPENPATVAYKRDMAFERATETVQSEGANLNFDFDSAYWMSELTPLDATPGAEEETRVASFKGTSHAIPEEGHLAVPDSGAPTAPGQTGPYVITGIQWLEDPRAGAPTASNAFDLTLGGTKAVKLDLPRMNIDVAQSIAGSVDIDSAVSLRLRGPWTGTPSVLIDGAPAATSLSGDVLTIDVPKATGVERESHELTIVPDDGPQQEATLLQFTGDSDRSAQYSDTAKLEASLATVSGAPIEGATVHFELAGADSTRSLDAVTGPDGLASVTFDVTETPGDYRLTASYAGSDTLTPAIDGVDFRVARDDSALSLTTVGRGANRILNATLFDSDSGLGLAAREVSFFSDGKLIGTVTTDDAGSASIAAPPSAGKRAVFEASFSGDTFYLPSNDGA